MKSPKSKSKPPHRLKCGACGAAFSAPTREEARRRFDQHDCQTEQRGQRIAQKMFMGTALALLTEILPALPPDKGAKLKPPKDLAKRTPNPAHPRWSKQ